jgi:hypothetical protein
VSEFSDNIDRLVKATPRKITGAVKVDQVYAHYQHEHPEFHHPDGGEAFYLKTPLYAKADKYLERLAEGAIQSDGTSGLKDAMIENMEDLSREVYDRAPWEFGDLRASGHPTVAEGEEVVYDRPPMVHRLDKDELAIKSHLRYLFDPNRYGRRS